MKQILLQAGVVPSEVTKLTDYGPMGVMLSIVTSGFIGILLVVYKNFKEQLKDKDNQLKEAKEEIKILREEIRELKEGAFKQMTMALNHNSDVIQENSKAYYETASVVNRTEGVMLGLTEALLKANK